MNEAARQEALKAMGVPVLLPRFQLPGAKPSPIFETLETTDSGASSNNDSGLLSSINPAARVENDSVAAVAYTNAANYTGDSLAKQTMQSVTDMFKGGKAKKQSKAQAIVEAEQAKKEEAAFLDAEKQVAPASSLLIDYQHYCIQLDNLLVIIDPVNYLNSEDLPLSFDEQAQNHIVRFLHDIHSLTFKIKPVSIKLNAYAWPPHKALPSEIQQADMAFSMEQAFLQSLSQVQPFHQVLVFSNGYTDALFGDVKRESLEHGSLAMIQNVKALHVQCVQNYWENSHLKNQLWQSLQAFI